MGVDEGRPFCLARGLVIMLGNAFRSDNRIRRLHAGRLRCIVRRGELAHLLFGAAG